MELIFITNFLHYQADCCCITSGTSRTEVRAKVKKMFPAACHIKSIPLNVYVKNHGVNPVADGHQQYVILPFAYLRT